MPYEVFEKIKAAVAEYRTPMYQAERYIWNHPQTGFKEWKANNYLKDVFIGMGYTLTEAGNIPGFYFDIDTGHAGPTVCILGELDSILCPEHPDSDPQTGAVHACGHNCQTAALVGIAGALKDKKLLNRMSGKIRIMAVPAEELLELEERIQMREQGLIRYLGGKTEFIARGYFDDVDIALMIHAGGEKLGINMKKGANGAIAKVAQFTGKAAHAAAYPQGGINALYAAELGMSAINALRETFPDEQYVRVHPIITAGGKMVNNIPAAVTIETQVRAIDFEVNKRVNNAVNRALTAGALALGADIEINDLDIYMTDIHDDMIGDILHEVCSYLLGEENVHDERETWDRGSSDMGMLSCLMPVHHPFGCGGQVGGGHGADYQIVDPEKAVVMPATVLLCTTMVLLEKDAVKAADVLKNYRPRFSDAKALLEVVDEVCTKKVPIAYQENNAAVLNWR